MDYKDYLEQGIEETNNGKFDEALHSLNNAISIRQDDPIAYFSLGIVFHNINEPKAAYENYTKAIVLNPKMCDAYYNRAHVILMNKNAGTEELNMALEDFENALELDPKFIDALYYKAVVQKKLEDYKGAVETLEKGLQIDPQAIYSKALLILIKQKYLK